MKIEKKLEKNKNREKNRQSIERYRYTKLKKRIQKKNRKNDKN